jgi:hypothetical protein
VYNIARVLRFPLHCTRECGALILDRERVRVYFIKEEQVLLDNSAGSGIIIKVSNY